ncbi:MAG: cobalamin biosynthesis protein CobN, partial [Methanosarcina mazei]
EDLVHFVSALTRIASKGLPSLREALATGLGCGLDELLEKRKSESPLEQLEGQKISDKLNQAALDFIRCIINGDNPDRFLEENQIGNRKQLSGIAVQIRDSLLPRLFKTSMEITNLVGFLKGKFVSPGPSGAPTRGQTEILPTGRNFYTLNPYAIPSQAAWKTGTALAEALLKRYMDENMNYPENIGYVLFGSPTIRTRGEDVAQIMYLMGARPVWQSGSQNVKGIEVIHIEELKRPRIDVTIRITGFFRDAFHNIVEMLDETVDLVSKLDEPADMNYIKKHIEADTEMLMTEESTDYAESRKKSAYRIFSAKPGAYGTGVNTLINSKNWSNTKDLSDMYVSYGSYAYGKDTFGNQEFKILKKRLSVLDLAVKNIDTKETDVLANDDNYSYLGGMVAAAGELSGRNIKGHVGDSSDPSRVKVKDIQEETRFVVRTKLLNPKWYNALKRHGFKGATDISST